MAEYSVAFHILAAESGWNEKMLQRVFLCGLNEQVKDKLVLKDELDSIDALTLSAIRLDNHMRESQPAPGLSSSLSTPSLICQSSS